MKYCPYCGATLLGGAVSFCAECGKPIPGVSQAQPVEQSLEEAAIPKQDSPESQTQAAKAPVKAKPKKQPRKERSSKKEKRRKERPPVAETEPDPQDEGYDGYYNDVRPVDNGHERERMDPELIKRIALVGGGAVLIIGLAIVMMLLL